jgi:hypothetical protein
MVFVWQLRVDRIGPEACGELTGGFLKEDGPALVMEEGRRL